MPKNIVIIGAGYAGILTAKKLERRIRKARLIDEVQITIIDRSPFHTMLTELHEVAGGRVDEDSIKISLRRVFVGRRIQVVLDEVQSVDFAAQSVHGREAEYHYDYLVLAAGSKPTFFGVEGAAEYSHKLWSFDDAVHLRAHIEDVFRRAARTTDMEEKKKLLTFYVVGAGFTGVEMAGELAEFKQVLCHVHEIDPAMVRIFDIDVLSRTVPTLSEKQSVKVTRRLNKMGVTCLMNSGVVRIGPEAIDYRKDGQTVTDSTATVIWAAGIESADIAGRCAEELETPPKNRGRIQVTPCLTSLRYENVYVVGDNMYYVPEGSQQPVLQVVENCEQSSLVCACNLMVALTGRGEPEVYVPKIHGFMVSVGSRYGVAEVGTVKKKISLASFFAMFVKHFINILYYLQVLGWNKVFSYVKHEFFTIRHCRSFVGGHLSNRTPSFLLMPLRVWLGMVWVFEGIKKIVEGWMTGPKLNGFFTGARAWYDSILGNVSGQAAAATDTTSSATGEVGEVTGQALINLKIWFLNIQLISGKTLAASTLGDLAFRLNVPLMDTFIDKVILPSNGMQMFFQIAIVVAEILIGLALIGGLFTTISSGASLVLQVMFVMTTGLYLGTVWMVFAAIAVLIGGGRTLGLDYYAMPALKKAWAKVRWARKWYLYHD